MRVQEHVCLARVTCKYDFAPNEPRDRLKDP